MFYEGLGTDFFLFSFFFWFTSLIYKMLNFDTPISSISLLPIYRIYSPISWAIFAKYFTQFSEFFYEKYYCSYFEPEGLGWQHHFLPKRSLLWAPCFSQYPSFLSCSIEDRRDKSSTKFELKTTAIATCISSKAIRTCNLLVFTISLVSTYCELDLLTIFK